MNRGRVARRYLARRHPSGALPRLLALALFVATGLTASADDAEDRRHSRDWDDRDADHERARQALARGEVLPIAEILRRVGQRIPGDLLELEFEREDDHGPTRWIYELEILGPDGHVREIEVDAATGEILEIEHDD